MKKKSNELAAHIHFACLASMRFAIETFYLHQLNFLPVTHQAYLLRTHILRIHAIVHLRGRIGKLAGIGEDHSDLDRLLRGGAGRCQYCNAD